MEKLIFHLILKITNGKIICEELFSFQLQRSIGIRGTQLGFRLIEHFLHDYTDRKTNAHVSGKGLPNVKLLQGF